MQVRQAPAILSIRNGVNWDNSRGACLQLNLVFVYAMSIDVGLFSETMLVTTCRFFSNSIRLLKAMCAYIVQNMLSMI